jgi:hypothetical protein
MAEILLGVLGSYARHRCHCDVGRSAAPAVWVIVVGLLEGAAMKLEVRCCCMPLKLLGYVDVDFHVCAGNTVAFEYLVPVEQFADGDTARRMLVALTAQYYSPPGDVPSYLALKSNDCPIEVLRQLPGFTEANDEQRRVSLDGARVAGPAPSA